MSPLYTNADFFPNQAFRLNIHTVDVDNTIPPHTHEFCELALILRGRAEHTLNGRQYALAAGDVFLINSHDEHAYDRPVNLRVCNILFDPAQLLHPRADLQRLPGFHALFYLEPHYRDRDQFQSHLRLGSEAVGRVATVLERMERELAGTHPGHETMLEALFMELVVYLARQYEGAGGNGLIPGDVARLARVVAFIEEHYAEPLRLEQLAKLAHLSKNHLLRVFKQCYQTTPGDYIVRLRLAKAKELMRHSGLSLSEIAYASGFGDSNYFSRAFRKQFGQAPRTWRSAQVVARNMQRPVIPARASVDRDLQG